MDQDKVSEPDLRSYLHWIPMQYLLPETTRVTLQRYRYQANDMHDWKMLGYSEPSFDYWSVLSDLSHMRRGTYEYKISNPTYWSHIQFDVAQSLI